MIKYLIKHKIYAILVVLALLPCAVVAETVSSGHVSIQYEPMADGGIKVINVWNKTDKRITLFVDGKSITVNANSSAQTNQYARRMVRFDYATRSGALLWKAPPQKEQVAPPPPPEPEVESQETDQPAGGEKTSIPITSEQKSKSDKNATRENFNFVNQLNNDSYFSLNAVNRYAQQVNSLCDGLDASKNKVQFLIDRDVKSFLEQSKLELNLKKSEIPLIAERMVVDAKIDGANQASTIALIVETLTSRLKSREESLARLDGYVASMENDIQASPDTSKADIVNYGIVGLIILVLILLTVSVIRRKNRKVKAGRPQASPVPNHSEGDNPAIVVRRRTTSILKKQCIDDVIDNPAYLVVDTSEFTPDSAVRKIYIKNSCIKDVYNMYAEDLRNSDNPKEDGCMVLGRWVHDEASHSYDISLEEVVLPGDDAVFKEYELNFGGKIKLRIAEKLRKLRRDTGLQYDLVCWIHSHPGLGVFFSNSDDNVQMQLKHSQHPNFLIAFVVDILTSNQETGIFTFRRDGSMNSKGDLMRMYSLEEMYKWALQSERLSFSPENYYNVVQNARLKIASCNGVEMNNSSIIDLTQIVIEPETGIVGWVIGTTLDSKAGIEFVVSKIAKAADRPKAGVVGCLINMAHMSLPTIQRLVSRDCGSLSFVMVYSSKQASLTTIPVINGELLTDERFYGDVNIDDLKIWTRRKR